MKPASRKARRAKIIEIAMLMIKTNRNGIRASAIQQVIEQSCRFRCSSNTIGQVLLPLINDGVIRKIHTVQGNAAYVYIPPLETETHGVET